jgi:hypothetical protein
MNANDRKQRIASLERRLAVMTHWGLAGSFGMAFLLSGFNASDWTCGLLGYALLIGGFVGHVLINHFFDSGFNAGEVALGLILFGLFALVFVVTALLTPQYNRVNLGLGITGFSVMALVLALYLIIRYGTRGTWNMVHSLWYRKAGK